jgi:HAD superfamily hydrolase (TIGR01549 family)
MVIAIFDLDQTIVDVSAYHIRAFKKAFKKVCGVDIAADLIRAQFGKVEHDFVATPLRKHGFSGKLVQEKIKEVVSEYKRIFQKEIAKASSKNVLPGVKKLLQILKRKNVFLCLATGEEEIIANLVLKKTKLRNYFRSFTFGGKARVRSEILRKAIQNAKNSGGKGKVIVIGDSLYDIKAAKAVKCKIIAVATGFTSMKALKSANPDFLFKDLTATNKVMTIINSF